MTPDFFRRTVVSFVKSLAMVWLLAAPFLAVAEPQHGIAMYGTPDLPPDFVSLPYANPDAPKGGRLMTGNVGRFDSLNPFVQKGTPPWQLRFLTHESLMGRSWDEPFTLYGLIAESIETGPNREWVEFTLRPEARFSDGSPVTVEDVIWSFETLGERGNLRYRSFRQKTESIEATGPRSVRLTFNTDDRELALIAGLRPILQKAQWEGRDFADAPPNEAPIGSGPYMIDEVEMGRFIRLARNPDYWGTDLNLQRGTHNFDEIQIDYFGDETVLKEAFKAQQLSFVRERNAEAWVTQYDIPAVRAGDIVLSEIPHATPSGMTGFVMNTRRPPLDDWRVREALLLAFNFEFMNDTVTGSRQPRITSYFSGSDLALRPGPAEGRVRDLLTPFADSLLPGAIEGYSLPEGDGTARNRGNIRKAAALLEEAGWQVVDGVLKNADGQPLELTVLLRNDGLLQQASTYMNLFSQALERLGITLNILNVDAAQYGERERAFDFDLTFFRRSLSLSPGNEQRLYWGSEAANQPGSRNLMGMTSPAADAMIDAMLSAQSQEEFVDAVRALDRVLISGRYVIPIHQFTVGRIAHLASLQYPKDRLPIYGDGVGFLPTVWWSAPLQ